jgi:hypothetical protein
MAFTFDQKLTLAGLGIAVLTFIAGLGVALGMDVRTKGEFIFVICCFGLCAISLTLTAGAGLWFSELQTWSRIVLSVLVLGTIWTGFFGAITWVSGRRALATKEVPYRITCWPIIAASDSDHHVEFVGMYKGLNGDTITTLSVLAYIHLTNLKNVPASIEKYQMEAQSKDGKWVKLIRVPSDGVEIFHIPNAGDLTHANRTQLVRFEDIVKGAIEPHKPADGWAFFIYPKGSDMFSHDDPTLRLSLVDDAGTEFTSEPLKKPKDDSAIKGGPIMLENPSVDLSAKHILLWSW